ncbi:hypothetical protein KXV73_008576, partial [Aspergillus fumigatus]
EIMSREHEAAVHDYHKRKGERLSGEVCDVCGTELYTDPGVHELGIFLHAQDALVPVPEEEEIVIGQTPIPEGMVVERSEQQRENPVLVRGVGLVDVSAARQQEFQEQHTT